uniref:VWFA domain-containing protein n=1 Tax=Arion vulgaris TaxID=1028688 RepID=A0A0B7ACB8_9EUPU
MDFASKFILLNDEDEYETISDEELEQGMQVSDSESDEENVVKWESARGERSLNKKTKLKHHWKQEPNVKDVGPLPLQQDNISKTSVLTKQRYRRADTNIVSVNFNTLLLPGNMHAGEPVICQSCQAILSHISKVDPSSKVWQCEFCCESAEVDIDPAEIPASDDVTFLLEPSMTTTTSSLSGVDKSLVVFCVDTSGSMCVTTEISGKIKLRGTSQLKRLQSFNEDNDNQFLPSQRNKDVTYISRLQAMQTAVVHQLTQMSQDHPDRRVALVAFNNEVAVVGDGIQTETIVAGDKLTNEEKLCMIGSDIPLPTSIKASRHILSEKVYNLEEGGATALGPALVVAINLAAHHPGSKVILCTDGKANIGIGKIEDAVDEQAVLDFYTKIAQDALEKGVTVSVITIGGTDCKLVHLGILADKTGGQVNIVDPLKLTEEFGSILADPVIATKVKATFLLHKELYVIDENDPDNQLFMVERNVGNVSSSTTITFEFARRQQSKGLQTTECAQIAAATSSEHPDTTETTAANKLAIMDFPFQLQIEYIDTEGNKALRVITRTMPATTQRKMTEENANLNVLGVHAAKKSAELALQGQFSRSRSVALMNQRLAWRHSHSNAASDSDRKAYKAIYGQIQQMENTVHSQLKQEIRNFGHSRSDSEPSDDEDSKHAGLPS